MGERTPGTAAKRRKKVWTGAMPLGGMLAAVLEDGDAETMATNGRPRAISKGTHPVALR